MLEMILIRLSMVVATFGCTFWFDIARRIGYVNKPKHNLHDPFLNMCQPAFMVLTPNVPNRPRRTTHTMCPERFDALLDVWRSHTLTSLDGTRHFGTAALNICIQSARNIHTDYMSRPPTCTLQNQDDLSCIRQIPPVFRKWFATHIINHNAGEALQSALTFTSGIFQHKPRLHSSVLHADPHISSTTASDWTCDFDDTSSSTWQHTPWPHSVFICFDDSSSQHLSSVKHKIRVTTSNTPHLILAFISTSTLTWKQLRQHYGATCIATIPPGCIPWGHAGG